MGRGVKGAAGAFRAGGKVRRGRRASVVGLAALVFLFSLYCMIEKFTAIW